LRGTTARLGLVATGRTFDAALLGHGTTARLLGTAILALHATAETSGSLAAGGLVLTTCLLGRTTVASDFVGDDRASQQQTKRKKGTGK
jgi:hypothetical protein